MWIDLDAFEVALIAHCDDAAKQMIAWTKAVSGRKPEVILPFILNPRSALQAGIEAYEAAKLPERESATLTEEEREEAVEVMRGAMLSRGEELALDDPDCDIPIKEGEGMLLQAALCALLEKYELRRRT